ncbi:hypothetical protein HPB49_023975 [Dermacentor silvarum]|uniref:Uncharacterized protein n=1 Tax=Dermacentor silvarum TaxID=543639 RepID=A0ACB8DGZ3_DERSI|nr:hypothetical protein HPB49_023975 [Dermacentor silvarum]
MGGVTVPDDRNVVLGKGPELSYEPQLSADQFLVVARDLVDKVDQHERVYATTGSIDCVIMTVQHKKAPKLPFQEVMFNSMNVLQFDKEEGFAMLPGSLLEEKATEEIAKVFKAVKFDPKQQRKAALKLLGKLILDR